MKVVKKYVKSIIDKKIPSDTISELNAKLIHALLTVRNSENNGFDLIPTRSTSHLKKGIYNMVLKVMSCHNCPEKLVDDLYTLVDLYDTPGLDLNTVQFDSLSFFDNICSDYNTNNFLNKNVWIDHAFLNKFLNIFTYPRDSNIHTAEKILHMLLSKNLFDITMPQSYLPDYDNFDIGKAYNASNCVLDRILPELTESCHPNFNHKSNICYDDHIGYPNIHDNLGKELNAYGKVLLFMDGMYYKLKHSTIKFPYCLQFLGIKISKLSRGESIEGYGCKKISNPEQVISCNEVCHEMGSKDVDNSKYVDNNHDTIPFVDFNRILESYATAGFIDHILKHKNRYKLNFYTKDELNKISALYNIKLDKEVIQQKEAINNHIDRLINSAHRLSEDEKSILKVGISQIPRIGSLQKLSLEGVMDFIINYVSKISFTQDKYWDILFMVEDMIKLSKGKLSNFEDAEKK